MDNKFVDQSSGAALIVKDNLHVNSLEASIIRLPFSVSFPVDNFKETLSIEDNVTNVTFKGTVISLDNSINYSLHAYFALLSTQSDQKLESITINLINGNGVVFLSDITIYNDNLSSGIIANYYNIILYTRADQNSFFTVSATIVTNDGKVKFAVNTKVKLTYINISTLKLKDLVGALRLE